MVLKLNALHQNSPPRKEEKSADKEILHEINKLLESYLALFFNNILKIKLEVTLNSVCPPHLNSSLDLPIKFFQLHALYMGPSIYYVHPQGGWVGCCGVYPDVLWWVGWFSLDVYTHHVQRILKINSNFSGSS